MGDGENSQYGRGFQVAHAVREAFYREAAHRQLGWHPQHPLPDAREAQDLANRGIDCVEELQSKTGPPPFVPAASRTVLGIGLILEPNLQVHGLRSSASARRRTSSQGMPADSPDITRRARRSISAAHAASTSAMSSLPTSSKLASNSAATSARWSIGNDNASRRTSCARDVM